ncbi:MAG: type II toxin-antitoxin system RelE/ParE family toxin [Proteobacteria bacterium]|nr:type II toxin-antitoxin system RelE/ParE family toxin [Pseudomonadota bacterium]MBS0461283.1 type II toxin-antitoxin system RelE/ParE family toxin [Pseudomonadota bacterium]
MLELRETLLFADWLQGLKDRQARVRVQERLLRLRLGNPGQHRVLKGGVLEMKIDYGPGYRVYCAQRGPVVVILLCGGDKRTQPADIRTAMRMASQV